MKIPIEGERRGLIARWLMRFEASQGTLQLAFLGVTAASTLVTALSLIGFESYASYILAIGSVLIVIYAWAYVELGIYQRKNREKRERGENFAKPQNYIDDVMIARGIHAARENRPLTQAERDAVDEEMRDAYNEHRSGVDI